MKNEITDAKEKISDIEREFASIKAKKGRINSYFQFSISFKKYPSLNEISHIVRVSFLGDFNIGLKLIEKYFEKNKF
jgi:hypothetical protein